MDLGKVNEVVQKEIHQNQLDPKTILKIEV